MSGLWLSSHIQKHYISEIGAGTDLRCKCGGGGGTEVPIRVGLIRFCQQELTENIHRKILLVQPAQYQTEAELSNIPDY